MGVDCIEMIKDLNFKQLCFLLSTRFGIVNRGIPAVRELDSAAYIDGGPLGLAYSCFIEATARLPQIIYKVDTRMMKLVIRQKFTKYITRTIVEINE